MVGFQNKSFGSNTFSMSGNTFINVSGGDIALGDLKVAAKSGTVDYNNFSLMLIGTDGNPRLVSQDTNIGKCENGASILSKHGDSTMQIVWVASKNAWYLYADSSSKYRKYPINDYLIPAGEGFLVRCEPALAQGAELTYNGSVNKKPTPVEADPNTFSVSANVAPKDVKLSEIVVTAKSGTVDYNNFSLMLIGTDGNPRLVSQDTNIGKCENGASILSKHGDSTMQIVWVASKNAWYLYADSSSKYRKYPINDYVIPAGEGFLVRCESALAEGVMITIPSALESDSAD